MVKLVVKWNTLVNNVYTDIISLEYEDITTENIEKYIKEKIATPRGKTLYKIVNITQLFDPKQIVTIRSNLYDRGPG